MLQYGIFIEPSKPLSRTPQKHSHCLPRYMYLTERIDQYLLSHSGQTLRRIRRHDQYPPNTSLSNLVHNYKLAIAGSTSYIKTEDPLKNLMLSSKSRDSLREIADESEDYQEGLGGYTLFHYFYYLSLQHANTSSQSFSFSLSLFQRNLSMMKNARPLPKMLIGCFTRVRRVILCTNLIW